MNASSACLRSSDGVKLSPNCRNRSMYSFFEFSFLYALIFPTPYRALTVSHPEMDGDLQGRHTSPVQDGCAVLIDLLFGTLSPLQCGNTGSH